VFQVFTRAVYPSGWKRQRCDATSRSRCQRLKTLDSTGGFVPTNSVPWIKIDATDADAFTYAKTARKCRGAVPEAAKTIALAHGNARISPQAHILSIDYRPSKVMNSVHTQQTQLSISPCSDWEEGPDVRVREHSCRSRSHCTWQRYIFRTVVAIRDSSSSISSTP
jgi:hypothetical protein